jgi:hypothetical protein
MLNRPQTSLPYNPRGTLRLCSATLLLSTFATFAPRISAQQTEGKATLNDAYGKLPLGFEANQGQTNDQVKFQARGRGFNLYLTGQGAVITLHSPLTGINPVGGHTVTRILSSNGVGPQPRTFDHPVKFAPLASATRDRTAQPADQQQFASDVLRLELEHADLRHTPQALDPLPGTANYILGKDPAKWHTNIPTYRRIQYGNVYPGVDLVYYGNQNQLEYDFVLAPGASARPIQMHFEGAKKLSLAQSGDLTISAEHGSIIFKCPVLYQMSNGARQPVEGRFRLLANRTVGFAVGHYDHTRPLVLDPTLLYSTYFGGSTAEFITAVTTGTDGSAYVSGLTTSVDFPLTAGAFQAINLASAASAVSTAFVSKFNASGTALMYSTYLGGNATPDTLYNQGDYGKGIAVDSSGDAYLAGYTYSSNFPVTNGAYQTATKQASRVATGFVTKLNPAGTGLVYSTYLGGNNLDELTAIAIDKTGSAYLSGLTFSTTFPVTSGAFQSTNKGASINGYNQFVTKLNPTGTGLVYSTYLGGTGDTGNALSSLYFTNPIVVDASGNAYVTAFTQSQDFPITAGAFQTTQKASISATLTKVNPTGTGLVYSTYLGGSSQTFSEGLAIDGSGNAYVAGFTFDIDFPVTSGAYQSTNKGANSVPYGNGTVELNPVDTNGFLTKFNSTGSALIYSTYLGGTTGEWGGDQIYNLAVDSAGDAYVAGLATSQDFPVTANAYQSTNRGSTHCCIAGDETYNPNAFLTEFNPGGTALLYSTFLGGTGQQNPGGPGPYVGDAAYAISLSSTGELFMVGYSGSSDFPTTSTAFDTKYNSAQNTGFVAAFNFGTPVTTAPSNTTLTASGNPVIPGTSVTFTAIVSPASGTGTPTGTIVFSIDESNVATVTLASGKATYTTSTLTAGEHYVLATYSGSSTYGTSGDGFNEVIQPRPPVITPAAGTYTSEQSVTITSPTAGGVLYYTLDGSTPTVFSTPYTVPILLTTSKTVNAVAVATEDANSTVASSAIGVIGSPSVLGAAATPVATTSATLNAFVNSLGLTGTYIFHYGTSATMLTTATTSTALTAGTARIQATANVTGLASGKTYYFQVTVTTAGGITNGPVVSFTTR